eukprot:TRINITY_DN4399_c0_g1_i1.p1 TRINITY_DN4399_c0_g1~~TRINITY_DN4399_c0_g1_i1.p1  ORF type:complete len:115 (+),score=3.06 TRINITY_DN4399_c0_g1_i1:870-1214(+)
METEDHSWRRRFSAIVCAFLVARRALEVLELRKQDLHLRTDGGVDLQVCRFQNGETRADPRCLAYVIPLPPARTPTWPSPSSAGFSASSPTTPSPPSDLSSLRLVRIGRRRAPT